MAKTKFGFSDMFSTVEKNQTIETTNENQFIDKIEPNKQNTQEQNIEIDVPTKNEQHSIQNKEKNTESFLQKEKLQITKKAIKSNSQQNPKLGVDFERFTLDFDISLLDDIKILANIQGLSLVGFFRKISSEAVEDNKKAISLIKSLRK